MNRVYLEAGLLHVELMGRGIVWLDTGTHDSRYGGGSFVQSIETRQGLKLLALRKSHGGKGIFRLEQLLNLAAPLKNSGYGDYLASFPERVAEA